MTDATETEKIINALALQYNTTSVKDAGAEVPHTPPPLSTPSPHHSHRTTTTSTHHHPPALTTTQPCSPSPGERHPLPRV
eukprot:scaffold8553_cov43-Phaeocystis_antarctica.AAC.2